MAYDFDTLVNRGDKYSRKWERMLKTKTDIDENIPPFSVADIDFKYPPQLVKKFNEYTEEMIFGYSRPNDAYYQSFIDWTKRRHDYEYQRAWIIDSDGVIPALYYAIEALTDENDGVMIMTPVYPPFAQSVKDTKRSLINVPLKNKNQHYTIDYELFEKYAKEDRTKLLILCNPHNPVGRVWTKDELKKLSDICEKYNIIVISDEIHMDLILDGHHHTVYLDVSEYAKNHSVILTAASKTFNIAGAQTSMVIIPNEEYRQKYQSVIDVKPFFGLNAFGFKLVEIVYNDCEDWLDELLTLISDNHKYLYDFINNHVEGVTAYPLEGTYLQWIDFSGLNMEDQEVFDFLLEEASLFLTAGKGYGEGGEGFLRWNIATPKHVLIDGLNRLKQAVDSLEK